MDDLLAEIEAYRVLHLLEVSTVGIVLANDGKLVPRLKGGRPMRLKTLANIRAALQRTPDENRALREQSAA